MYFNPPPHYYFCNLLNEKLESTRIQRFDFHPFFSQSLLTTASCAPGIQVLSPRNAIFEWYESKSNQLPLSRRVVQFPRRITLLCRFSSMMLFPPSWAPGGAARVPSRGDNVLVAAGVVPAPVSFGTLWDRKYCCSFAWAGVFTVLYFHCSC